MNPITDSLQHFLTNDTLRVAVLKGEWGIGKTFFWNNFLKEHRASLKFRAYSYVSLFGVQEPTALDRQILLNFEILDETKVSRQLEKLKPLANILHAVDIPYLNSSGPITDLINSKLVDNFLICFDDLERKEPSISGSSILGLISRLKEEKHCKIVLIYNDKELDDETARQINDYREKVVDIELTYQPSIDDNLAIIWPTDCPACVKSTFHTLELNNIRVMQRVKWSLDYFSRSLGNKYTNLFPAFQSKCVALTVIYHAYSSSVSLKEAMSTSYYSLLLSKDKEDAERFKVIKLLNYLPEDQDVIIAEYLTNGYVDISSYDDLLLKKNEHYRINNIQNQHHDLWRKYHSSFVTPQADFVKLLKAFLENNIDDLGLRDVNQSIEFIKVLDPSINLDSLLTKSIDRFAAKIDRLDRRESIMLNLGSELTSRIEAKLASKSKHYSIAELFVALAGSNSWNPGDIEHLTKFTADDYYQWFTTDDTVEVIDLVREFLQRFNNTDAKNVKIITNIHEALDRLKTRSRLDLLRIENLIERK